MSKSELEKILTESLNELESSGDIVISTTTPNVVIDKLVQAVSNVYPITLTELELSAVKNAVHVTYSGFKLDDWDFQTHIGLTKDELAVVFKKLGNSV
ncbi:hypothetical protein [Agaribacter marinus]|uniref:Uncharacterized protein n=1 Tax=Agaribacter marinus TaxID=1431249 RepID=A0AA37T0N2_9ALTE|nr:hypothetical protein [Agaribacter marinus]GLR72667.1 hypothetical protein GCM10007852_35750 [Agaribacter marinus]